ncbi:DUF6491 family protein [Brevundimonas sp.]|uniref:DUF6491 family protein n=1 Tax=Brevundimonas sp. TaxID=1871086 RepID=UPI002EDA8504
MSRFTPSLLVIAAVLLAGCAPTSTDQIAAATPERQCMFPDDVQSFRVRAADRTVFVRGTSNAVFELQPAGDCNGLNEAMRLAVVDQVSRVCVGDWTTITSSPSPAPCRVRVVKRLTAAEVAALPDRDRP